MNRKRLCQKRTTRSTDFVGLAVVLYDQLIRHISRASDALAHYRSEQCTAEIGHALAVIGYLRATLREDDGRDFTHKLGDSYTVLREKLLEAQVHSSRQILSELQQQLRERREPPVMGETDTFTVK